MPIDTFAATVKITPELEIVTHYGSHGPSDIPDWAWEMKGDTLQYLAPVEISEPPYDATYQLSVEEQRVLHRALLRSITIVNRGMLVE